MILAGSRQGLPAFLVSHPTIKILCPDVIHQTRNRINNRENITQPLLLSNKKELV